MVRMSKKAQPVNLFGLSEAQIMDELKKFDPTMPRYGSTQIYNALYAKRIRSFDEMTELPRELRLKLSAAFPIATPKISHESRSIDGTIKYLFELSDGCTIESVLIPSEMRDAHGAARRKTLCLSTQVGCPLDCK